MLILWIYARCMYVDDMEWRCMNAYFMDLCRCMYADDMEWRCMNAYFMDLCQMHVC
jgi:hypothetical protein